MDNLSTVDKLFGPNVSHMERFHCSCLLYSYYIQFLVIDIHTYFILQVANVLLYSCTYIIVFDLCKNFLEWFSCLHWVRCIRCCKFVLYTSAFGKWMISRNENFTIFSQLELVPTRESYCKFYHVYFWDCSLFLLYDSQV